MRHENLPANGVNGTPHGLFERLSTGVPSQPLLGLPVRRTIPMDLHSVLDYQSAATALLSARLAETDEACWVGSTLGAAYLGVSLLTDYKLSVAKVIPIEVHEVIDYVWGAAAIALPFALGYHKKDPLAATLHIASGALALLGSLFTDYRAARGVTWGKRLGRARAL